VSWHCNIKPALSITGSILNRNRMSLCLLRTLLPRVMTATEASKCGLILLRLPIKLVQLLRLGVGTRLQSGVHPYPHWHPRFAGDRGSTPIPIPDSPGIGGPLPSPSPICRGSGIIPIPGSHRGFRALGHTGRC
jgi:hypothetical protein